MRLYNIGGIEYFPDGRLKYIQFRDPVTLTSEEILALPQWSCPTEEGNDETEAKNKPDEKPVSRVLQ